MAKKIVSKARAKAAQKQRGENARLIDAKKRGPGDRRFQDKVNAAEASRARRERGIGPSSKPKSAAATKASQKRSRTKKRDT